MLQNHQNVPFTLRSSMSWLAGGNIESFVDTTRSKFQSRRRTRSCSRSRMQWSLFSNVLTRHLTTPPLVSPRNDV